MTFQAVNAFLLHLKVLQFDCSDEVGKKILQKSILACYAKTNEMLKFETLFTDNDKTKILKEFTDYNSKIDNDNHSEENFDPKADKITENLAILQFLKWVFPLHLIKKTVNLKFSMRVLPLYPNKITVPVQY